MKKPHQLMYILACIAGATFNTTAHSATTVFSGSGAAATTEFTRFQAAIKAVKNDDGQRINWDAVKLDGTDANPNTRVIDSGKTVEIPVNRFMVRGVIFADPYSVSGDGFASVNSLTSGQFPSFTPNNVFAMFDPANGKFKDFKIQQNFVFTNTTNQAGTRGFGAIFIDVEQEGSSSIEYFGRDAANNKISLGKYTVKPGSASGEAQFLGVLFDEPIISDVEITPGTAALFSFDGNSVKAFGAEELNKNIDLAVTDDFFFATPETLKTSSPDLTASANCLFNWAEKVYWSFFSPASTTQSIAPYIFRYYANTRSYLGVSTRDQHVYYLDSSNYLYDAGALSGWLNQASCK